MVDMAHGSFGQGNHGLGALDAGSARFELS